MPCRVTPIGSTDSGRMGTLASVVVLLGALSTGKGIESEIIATTVGSSVMMPCAPPNLWLRIHEGWWYQRDPASSSHAEVLTATWHGGNVCVHPQSELARDDRTALFVGRQNFSLLITRLTMEDSGTFFCTLSLNTSNTEHSKDYIIRVYEDLAALMGSEDGRSDRRNSTAEVTVAVDESRRIAGQSFAVHFLCTAAVTGVLLLAFAVHCFLHRRREQLWSSTPTEPSENKCLKHESSGVPCLKHPSKHEEDKEEEEEHFDDYSNLHMAHRDSIYENINRT